MLTISVKNLGPIAEGTVDLKPLTIFVGPSNTGKSYMATAIHVIVKALQGDDLFPPRRMFVGGGMYTTSAFGNLWDVPSEDSVFGDAVWAWARQLKKDGLDPHQLTVSSLPGAVRAALEVETVQEMGKVRSDAITYLRQEHRNPSAFVTRGAQPADFRITIRRDEPRLNMDIQLVDEESARLDFDISDAEIKPSPRMLIEYEPEGDREPIDVFYEVVSSWINSLVAKVLEGVPGQSYYLPAARSGIVLGHKVLAGNIVRRSARSGGSIDTIPTLPGVTTEFLGNLISLDRRMRRRTADPAMDNAISFIEDGVLHGKIDLAESAALPISEIVYLPSEPQSESGEFTLDETSSMVSELAPLIMFLKYLVRQGDLLILEEPESHLHPAAQRMLARGLVRLVNAGVKVIITTHSDMFVGQINNSLALSSASSELIEEQGFEPCDSLKPEQVSACLFKYDREKGGSVIQSLEIEPDTGIDEEEFAEVIEAIYNESISLQRDRVL